MWGTDEKRILKNYGITQGAWAVVRPWMVALVICFVVVGIIYWLAQPASGTARGGSPEQTTTKDFLQIAFVVLGFAFTYVQWVLARYEGSLDRFYERLDLANQKLSTMLEQAWARASP